MYDVDFAVAFISLKTKFMDAINNNKKGSLNIDFAPMVDLGFLLITFFIFTTELSKPKAFGLHVPDDREVIPDPPQTPHSVTITLLMKENGVIDYFEGKEEEPLQKGTTSIYANNSLRNLLIDKRNRILQQHNTDSNYTVLIRPSDFTTYKELIDVLDEMKITDIKKYVLLNDAVAKQ
jgi:biopolymer transport protein ExbD